LPRDELEKEKGSHERKSLKKPQKGRGRGETVKGPEEGKY